MKQQILDQLILRIKTEIHEIELAAKAAKDYATDLEFMAESKYDTRSLEASYLASAEAQRVEELKLEVQMLEEVDLKISQKSHEICIGSLVELCYQNHIRSYFLIPTSGGTLLQIADKSILVVSAFSPLGNAILGLKKGELVEVETPKEIRTYEVISHQ